MDNQQRTQTLPEQCAVCGAATSGKRTYCSPACKQAAYRQRMGVQIHAREDGHEYATRYRNDSVHLAGDETFVKLCAVCGKPTAIGKRGGYLKYCSAACSQQAKRNRRKEWKRQHRP